MERNVTNPSIDRLNKKPCSGAHTHAPTRDEIQRWEDDGGAILPEPLPQPERHSHREEAERVAA
jgi:hypothetical protein